MSDDDVRGRQEAILARRHELRQEYAGLYEEVEALLFRHDPMSINFGSNTDEYDPEVETILPRVTSGQTLKEMQQIIYQEFVRWFSLEDVGSDPGRFEAIAEDVHSAVLRHRSGRT